MLLMRSSAAKARRKMDLAESRMWARSGVEPTTTALLADPIALLLMRADRLTTREVEVVIREARRRYHIAPNGATPTM